MSDIEGIFIESTDFDGKCYFESVKEIITQDINSNRYKHVTDSGILDEFLMHETDKKRQYTIKLDVKCLFIKKYKTIVKKMFSNQLMEQLIFY